MPIDNSQQQHQQHVTGGGKNCLHQGVNSQQGPQWVGEGQPVTQQTQTFQSGYASAPFQNVSPGFQGQQLLFPRPQQLFSGQQALLQQLIVHQQGMMMPSFPQLPQQTQPGMVMLPYPQFFQPSMRKFPMFPFQLQDVMGGFYPAPQPWSQPLAMEVDNESLTSAFPWQGTNQSVVSSTVMQNKRKAKATNTDQQCQEVEEMEQHLDEVIQHAEDAEADPELTRASFDDEGVQAVVAALLAHIDALRDEVQVMERGKERIEAENAKLQEELRRMRDECQHQDASPSRDSANKQQWGR